jgi:N-carbamoylputrescine amidase
MKRKIKISCLQHKYKGSPQQTIEYVMNEIVKLGAKGVNVLCLQELFTSSYFCKSMDLENFKYAMSESDALFNDFCGLAKEYEMVLLVPFFEKTIEGLFYNSVLVIDADGKVIGKYRKNHIPEDPCFYEKYYFAPGDGDYEVFNTRFGKIAVLICWDQWFPEAARIVGLMGADIIFYPSAIGILEGEESLEQKFKQAWITIQRASAIANGLFVCSVNRTGVEDKIDFWGNSFICDTFGEIISDEIQRDEGALISEIDLNSIQETRVTWPFYRDRRIDTYAPILNRIIKQ